MARADKTTRPKKAKPVSARPKLVRSYTDSPTVPGAREAIDRVFDGLEAMHKRKQLSKHEYRAAQHIRSAYDVVHGSPGGVMDLDRVRGGGSSGPQAAPPYMQASETLRLVKQWTYSLDYRLIQLVVMEGHTVTNAAAIIHRREPTRTEKEEAGQRLGYGLQQVAENIWGKPGDEDVREITAFHAAGSEYTAPKSGLIEPGNVVHATGQRIFKK